MATDAEQGDATSSLPNEARMRAQRALAVPLLTFLGASLTDVGGGLSITLAPGANALNAVGALHGGVIATLLDVAAYISVASHLADHEEAVTIAFAASYFAAAEAGEELRAVGSVLRRSRHLAFATAELRGQSTVLALASVTKAIRSTSSPAAECETGR
jgi:uncharacterized protein (TIGR00369 family)